MSILQLNNFFKPKCQTTSVLPQLRGKVALKASQHFVEKKILNNQEILILHDLRELDFSEMRFYSDITALTAFNRNGSGVDGGLCRDKGVNDVLLES